MATNTSWNNQIAAAKSGITLNSGTNAVNISTDASATTVSIGTGAAAKTVTVGSTNTTSSLTLRTGAGGMFMGGVAGGVVSNKNYTTINTSTGALGSDSGPASGSLILIQTQNVSGVTTIDFTTGITNAYGCYLLLFRNNAAVSTTLQLLFSDNGGSSYINSGYISCNQRTAWNGTGWTNDNNTAALNIAIPTAGGVNNINGYYYIFNLATSLPAVVLGRQFTVNSQNIVAGNCSTTGINALRVQQVSGTITASLSLYGILS